MHSLLFDLRRASAPLSVCLLSFRFRLQEVRTDPNKYKYLLLPSLAKWQECSVNINSVELANKGLNCLDQIANYTSLVTLASQLVINVIVSSSPDAPYCSDKDVTCDHTIWGYAQAQGPWSNSYTADPEFQEGNSSNSWVWIRFNMFDIRGRNNADNAWEGGGSTLAHEVRLLCCFFWVTTGSGNLTGPPHANPVRMLCCFDHDCCWVE
jgi:hypothetical protein